MRYVLSNPDEHRIPCNSVITRKTLKNLPNRVGVVEVAGFKSCYSEL